ncbi:MAG: circadian clock KaiB family protein [Aquisalimonadaceae bacterium]
MATTPIEESSRPIIELYIAGDAPGSLRARTAVQNFLQQTGIAADLEVVDVLREPSRALAAGLLATPTLVIYTSQRITRVVGDRFEEQSLRTWLGTPS